MIEKCECKNHTDRCLHDLMSRIAIALEEIAEKNVGLVETLQAIENEIVGVGNSIDEVGIQCDNIAGNLQ